MIQVQEGGPVLVVQHDNQTRQPRRDGRRFAAHVTEITGIYILVTFDDPAVHRQFVRDPTNSDSYYRESGWRAWDGAFCWRLQPVSEAAR